MRLVDRHPHLDASTLVDRFVPPRRFEDVRLANYQPNVAYPTQSQALTEITHFMTSTLAMPRKHFWQRRSQQTPPRPARYLDGGFGVGKTHLLAGAWHAFDDHKAYTTFGELTAFIGFAGMKTAIETCRDYRLFCIDEFELDDVANTLMIVSFLRGVMEHGEMKLLVTSNTLPDRLGEQRFSAADFRREITAIASYFDEFRIDGPDYRVSHATNPLTLHHHQDRPDVISHDTFGSLVEHLQNVHPVHYGAMLDGIDGVVIKDVEPLRYQDDALLVVQLIDKLYDARIPVHIEGCSVENLFSPTYRQGGYRKKYGRAESRIVAMKAESTGLFS